MPFHESETIYLVNRADPSLVEIYTDDPGMVQGFQKLPAQVLPPSRGDAEPLRTLLSTRFPHRYLLDGVSLRLGRKQATGAVVAI